MRKIMWLHVNNKQEKIRDSFIQTVYSIKTTAYDQNNNMQWYLHFFTVQKSSKSS